MIEANELRIGNYLQGAEFKNPFYISALDIYELSKRTDTSILEPLPLTLQILEKCGFKKWKELHFKQWGWVCKNITVEVNDDGEIIYLHEPNIVVELKYLHQLQKPLLRPNQRRT